MKITFILPSGGLSGGVRIICNYANGLQRKGHNVTIVAPYFSLQRTPLDKRDSVISLSGLHILKAAFDRYIGHDHLKNFEGTLISPLTLDSSNIPDSDIIVATAWQTAEWLAEYPDSKGVKFYFIQHYEIWNGPKERVDATWKLPINIIVIANWLKNLGENEFGAKILGPLYNSIDHWVFYPDRKKVNDKIRIGMLYHEYDWKGFADGLKAFHLVQQKINNLQLVLISTERKPKDIPKNTEYYFRPDQNKMREIYSNCDIWMCPSWSEGFHLPPFEAMACGCSLVSTKIGGVEDICEHEIHALISEPKNINSLSANLLRVCSDVNLRNTLANNGLHLTQTIKWDEQVNTLENIFLKKIAE